MSVKYELLKHLVKAAGIKKRWMSQTTEELLENRMKQNAKNRIPDLQDRDFQISRIEVMGFPVLKLIHKEPSKRANLFLIGGGMISAPRPGSVRKALRIAKETGLYACAPSFEAAMKKYSVDYQMIVGEGMFHCYPVFPICKEAKEGWDMMVRLMKA